MSSRHSSLRSVSPLSPQKPLDQHHLPKLGILIKGVLNPGQLPDGHPPRLRLPALLCPLQHAEIPPDGHDDMGELGILFEILHQIDRRLGAGVEFPLTERMQS